MEHILAQGYGIVATEGDGEACRWWQRYYGQKQPAALPFDGGEGTADLLKVLPLQVVGPGGDEASFGVSETDGALWRAVLEELALQMTHDTFDTWLADTHLVRREGDRFIVRVRDEAARDWITHRLKRPILRTLWRLVGEEGVDVSFVEESKKVKGNGT